MSIECRDDRKCSDGSALHPSAGRNKVQVVWELSVKKIDGRTCEYSNHIHATASDEFLAFLKEHNIPFEKARATRQQASDLHNREETMLKKASTRQRVLTTA